MIDIELTIPIYSLETRAGAEEVIERLHGRMVRGWNDTGSRISVRFADTSEQRELRVRLFSLHCFLHFMSVKCLLVSFYVSERNDQQTKAKDLRHE